MDRLAHVLKTPLMVIRNSRDPFLAVFDSADPFFSTPQRNVTTTPNQALLMLNGPWALERDCSPPIPME